MHIDKNRKIPVTTFLRALGLGTDAQIREFFGDDDRIEASLTKDVTQSEEEGLLETYRKLRPGEPPTVESAQSHLNSLFFDDRRYDLSRFGRYKINKKLAIAGRLKGFAPMRDVIDPLTGELLAAKGEVIRFETAQAIEKAGISVVYLDIEGREIKVISNGMVNDGDKGEGKIFRDEDEAMAHTSATISAVFLRRSFVSSLPERHRRFVQKKIRMLTRIKP